MATIDVLLPVRNGIAFLAESLESLSRQTYRDWRVLVLDHGSIDGSRELAERYSERDSRIQVRCFAEARGLADLLNRGIEQADCRYLVRHDADDVCYPNRLDVVCNAFRERPECAAIGGQVDVVNGTGAGLWKMELPTSIERVRASCFFRNPVAHPTAAFDFKAVKALGITYGSDFLRVLPPEQRIHVDGLAEDYLLFGQLALLGRCANVQTKVIQYRWHGGNVGALKYHDQMMKSLSISRFLARSLCAMHDLPSFDPAPFCNLGNALLNVDGLTDFEETFERMASTLRAALGQSQDLERELAFRRVLATRRSFKLLRRYLKFRKQYHAETGEYNSVKAWITRYIRGKAPLSVSSVFP